jgi:hypothetical protein
MPKYHVIYSIADTYETTIEVDSPEDIEDYLNEHAWEEGFDRSWVGGGIIRERYYPVRPNVDIINNVEETNA